jgi:hypothetical protein
VWTGVLAFALLAAVAGAVSILRGQDANWDLQNYHYYNPWAWWNGRIFDRDIAGRAVADVPQPALRPPFFAMVRWNWPPSASSRFVLACLRAWPRYFLARLVTLAVRGPARRRSAAWPPAAPFDRRHVAMGIATLGTTMNEWPGVALVIGRALARRARSRARPRKRDRQRARS